MGRGWNLYSSERAEFVHIQTNKYVIILFGQYKAPKNDKYFKNCMFDSLV